MAGRNQAWRFRARRAAPANDAVGGADMHDFRMSAISRKDGSADLLYRLSWKRSNSTRHSARRSQTSETRSLRHLLVASMFDGGYPRHGFSCVHEATVNSKPRISRGYRRPSLDPPLNQRTTLQPPPEPGGSLTNSNKSATVLAYGWRRGRW